MCLKFIKSQYSYGHMKHTKSTVDPTANFIAATHNKPDVCIFTQMAAPNLLKHSKAAGCIQGCILLEGSLYMRKYMYMYWYSARALCNFEGDNYFSPPCWAYKHKICGQLKFEGD